MFSQLDIYKVICLVILFLVVQNVNCRSAKTKYYSNSVPNTRNQPPGFGNNTTDKEQGRGLFLGGGLLALGKVLNFFPVGGERECQPEGYSIAKAGICINQYDCRQRDGRASGDCAQGLGVCCVFEVSCGAVVQNNLTYFLSPGFPELWTGDQDCNITIEKTFAGIMQLRIDFIHFTIGQPNRSTGDCDEDAMILGDGDSNFTLCGQNHGQHIYHTLSTASEKRDTGELAGARAIKLSMRMRGGDMPRLWLLRLAQMPLANTAPHGCLQYYTADNGTIKTFNFASNGRHLASQDYKACVRKNSGTCSIRYTPCDRRSFRIGSADSPTLTDEYDMQADDQMMPVNDDMMTQDDEIEGSGDEPQIAPVEEQPSMLSRIWTYIWSWMWGQARSSSSFRRWSPYTQHYGTEDDRFRYYGYGDYGAGFRGYGRQRCQDRITIPCENEYLISSSSMSAGVCDPHHCGSSFCPGQNRRDCRIETSISPYEVAVRFGPPVRKRSPEDNIGACLRYTQLPCDSY